MSCQEMPLICNTAPLRSFAICIPRREENAFTTFLHLLHSHLEKLKAHAKILLLDFSATFNTIKLCISGNVLSDCLVCWLSQW